MSAVEEHFVDSAYAGKLLEETVFENGFLVDKLLTNNEAFREALQGTKIKNLSAKDICGTNGFTSQIFLVAIAFENDKKFTVVLKIFSNKRIDEMLKHFMPAEAIENKNADVQKFAEKISLAHNTECNVYELFGGKREVRALLPMPEIYYTQKVGLDVPGIIMMNDLTEVSCLGSLPNGLRVEQVRQVVGHLAAFHKHLLCSDDDTWKTTFTYSLFEECDVEGMGDKMIEKMIALDKDKFEVPMKRLSKTLHFKFSEYAHRKCLEELGIPEVLVHGDLWTNNILWKEDSHGQASDQIAAFIDWQISFKGNPMSDLARLVALCCDAEVRRELEDSIIDFYHEKFSELMKEAGQKVEFTLQQLKKAFFLAEAVQLIGCGIMVPFFDSAWAVPEGDTVKLEEKKKNIEKMLNRSKAAVDDCVKTLEQLAPEWLTD